MPEIHCPQTSDVVDPLERLKGRLLKDKVTRLGVTFLDRYIDIHLKDIDIDEMDEQRGVRFGNQWLVSFGSDSFLGLDKHPHVQAAISDAMKTWGTHNGASRAFSSSALCTEAEHRLAEWLGVEDTLIYASVTLANAGLIPALAGKGDLLIVDRHSHNSIQEAAKIASANGAIVKEMFPCRGEILRDILEKEKPKGCVIAVDGVYSMAGTIPPLAELNEVAKEYGADMYIDDAHGTGVVGDRGRGAAYQALGNLSDVLMVGSLSKAFSCMGGFVTCKRGALKRILKIKSNTFIFGGPVPPPYLAGIIAVCDIIQSPEYELILGNLHMLIDRLTNGLRSLGLNVLGGNTSIVSVTVGDIEQTFKAGKWLFDRGFYVQSATYPAVPINGGLLRIQVNANHTIKQVDDLLNAIMELKGVMKLPTTFS